MKRSLIGGTVAVIALAIVWQSLPADTSVPQTAAATPETHAASVDRGRYLVQVAGCNDCHTSRYPELAGKVPEQDWLTGDAVGWSGPWGTTYPINLRLYFADMTAEQWLLIARSVVARPPMPWFNLHVMSDADLLAIYHYVRALGPAGTPAPAYLPPGETAQTPAWHAPTVE
ncbi:MAG TPA: hypothetical protein PKL49_07805 [Steroidobacteraceae bacterium]|jgi:mono/diheme cytochrome c family protein|nr:hypothetical protein [Steroidobacteraceae bacterium]HNS28358.1 hypothetical protein [Steroidobacteraceae bacterium]